MKNLLKFAFVTFAALRTTSEGKTLVVVNLQKTDELEDFKANFFPTENTKNNEVDFLTNPLNQDALKSELGSGKYHTIALQGHGEEGSSRIPSIFAYGDSSVPFTKFIDIVNQDNAPETIKIIHISSCFIGKNFNQLANSNSLYYQKLNKSLKDNQLLFLHGDEYTGEVVDSYNNRLRNLISNKNYSIIEALFDSAESLNVVFKANGQLKIHQTKSFGRNNEEFNIESYRNHLFEEAEKAKNFEVENNILDENSPRIDVKKLTDEELEDSLGRVFFRYFSKLFDAKNYEKINELIEKNVNLNSQSNKRGFTALIIAAQRGHLEIAELLLEKKSKVDLKNKAGWTAMMYAAEKGHLEIAKLLLEGNSIVDLQENGGWTALMFATNNGHAEMLNLLLKNKAGVDLKNNDGLTALMFAAKGGHLKIAELLLEGNSNVDLKNNVGWTALMLASGIGGYKDIVNFLVQKGANLKLQNNQNESAHEIALKNNHNEIANLIEQKVKENETKVSENQDKNNYNNCGVSTKPLFAEHLNKNDKFDRTL